MMHTLAELADLDAAAGRTYGRNGCTLRDLAQSAMGARMTREIPLARRIEWAVERIVELEAEVAGLERFRKLRLRHNDEMERVVAENARLRGAIRAEINNLSRRHSHAAERQRNALLKALEGE